MKLSKLENFSFSVETEVVCDLFIVCSSSESRCLHIFSSDKVKASQVFVGMTSGSAKFFEDIGSNSTVYDSMAELLGGVNVVMNKFEGELKVVLDISCVDQYYMAGLVDLLSNPPDGVTVELIVLYNIASFSPPVVDSNANESIEPVHRSFAGWSMPDSRPTSLILGLGYEPHKAEGASEYFEPSDQWVFLPRSPVSEFLDVVKNNNRALLEKSDGVRLIEYDVDDPETTYGQIEVVISILLKNSNPVLLPFGPKIFFFLCLIHCLRHRELGVWRVSKGANQQSLDIQSSGVVVGVRCIFSS
jgi:hypothetical protein